MALQENIKVGSAKFDWSTCQHVHVLFHSYAWL